MPLYDYRCTECGREVEVMHGIHATGPEKCEHCGGAMRKALSPPAIHFKGKGWAKKDAAAATAKKAKPKASSTSDKGETTSTSGEGSKSESSAKTGSTEPKGKPASNTGRKTD